MIYDNDNEQPPQRVQRRGESISGLPVAFVAFLPPP
jgi:hypothetical protein